MSRQKASGLRNEGRRAILDLLASSRFNRRNFLAAFEGLKEAGALAVVTFAPNPEWSFKICKHSAHPGEPRYFTLETPGEDLADPTRHDRKDLPECLAALERWIGRLVEDSRHSSPLADDLAELRETVAAELKLHAQDPQAHGAPQVRELQAKLEELGQKYEELRQQYAAQEKCLEELKARLTESRPVSHGGPRESWFTSTGVKVVD